MECAVCGMKSDARLCARCSKIEKEVVKTVGEDVWNKMDDCSYIYPLIKRVAEGDLTVKDVVNEILKGEMD